MKTITKLWIGIVVLIILSPLGLIFPEHFKSGSAWGEWDVSEINKLVGYIPQGLAKLSSLWNAPFPGYAFKGWEEKGLSLLSYAYIISALIGIVVIVAIVFIIGKALTKRGK